MQKSYAYGGFKAMSSGSWLSSTRDSVSFSYASFCSCLKPRSTCVDLRYDLHVSKACPRSARSWRGNPLQLHCARAVNGMLSTHQQGLLARRARTDNLLVSFHVAGMDLCFQSLVSTVSLACIRESAVKLLLPKCVYAHCSPLVD